MHQLSTLAEHARGIRPKSPIRDGATESKSKPSLAQCRARFIAAGKVALVVALLAFHFAARWHHALTMPLADRHNYEQTYAYSLSLLAGKGFHNLAVPPTPEAAPIARFLAKESDRVTRQEFQTFLANPGPQDFDADAGEHNVWASSRILDQYVVAGLWRLFGIRWQAVFLFAVAMSTLSCLFVFFHRAAHRRQLLARVDCRRAVFRLTAGELSGNVVAARR